MPPSPLGLAALTDTEPRWWALAVGVAGFVLLATGAYKVIERVLVALVVVMSIVFVVGAILVRPDLGEFARGLFVPTIPTAGVVTVIALIGTTVVPYNLFLHASSVQEKWPAAVPTDRAPNPARTRSCPSGWAGSSHSQSCPRPRLPHALPGNSERFFPLFIGLFVLAAAIAIRAWTTIDTTDLPPTSRRLDRALGTFLLLVAAFLTFGLHLPGLADAMRAQPAGPEYLADPFLFWLVKFMDLGIVVPALVVIGVGILRGVGWARQAVYAAVGWFALLGTAVAGMAIMMQSTGDPAASVANTVAFTGFALFALAVAAVVFQPLLARPGAR